MNEVTYDDFSKIDLRVAKIEHVEKIPGKTRVIQGIISLGDEMSLLVVQNFMILNNLLGKQLLLLPILKQKN